MGVHREAQDEEPPYVVYPCYYSHKEDTNELKKTEAEGKIDPTLEFMNRNSTNSNKLLEQGDGKIQTIIYMKIISPYV